MLRRKLLFFFILMWVNLEWDLKVEVGKPWGVPKGAVRGLCRSCCLQEQGLLQAFCLEKKWSPAFLVSVACEKVVGGVPSAALLPFLHLLGKLCFVGRASGWPPSPAGSPLTELFLLSLWWFCSSWYRKQLQGCWERGLGGPGGASRTLAMATLGGAQRGGGDTRGHPAGVLWKRWEAPVGWQEGSPCPLGSGGLLLGSLHLLPRLPCCLLPGLTRFSCISTPQRVCFHLKVVF